VVRVNRFLPHDARVLRLGLSSVIEDNRGRLGYWALRHAPGKPDFHNPEGFAFEISRPAAGCRRPDAPR
jgi:hypothetical protein